MINHKKTFAFSIVSNELIVTLLRVSLFEMEESCFFDLYSKLNELDVCIDNTVSLY